MRSSAPPPVLPAAAPHHGLRWSLFCAAGLLVLGLLAGATELPWSWLAAAVGAGLLLSGLVAGVAAALRSLRRGLLLRRISAIYERDSAAAFLTDREGEVIWLNAAGRSRYPFTDTPQLSAALTDYAAHPSEVIRRLSARALAEGVTGEDVVTRAGVLRLQVIRCSRAALLWRFDLFVERSGLARGSEGISLPMLMAGKGGAVLYANKALRDLTGGRPRTLEDLIPGTPVGSGGIIALNAASGPVQAVMIEVEGAAERREIYFLPLSSLPAIASLQGLEDLPLALMRLGADGTILASNTEAQQMLRLTPGEAINASALLDGPGRPLREWIADVAAQRAPARTETLRLLRAPGPDSFVRLTLRPWGGAARNGLLALLVDATEIRSLQAQFTQSQKMQLVGQLAGGVAHDFNNLLTAISGHCDLLLLNHDALDPEYADLSQIRQNANRAAGLVSQLLAFSRKQTMHAEYLYLQDVVRDMTQLLARLVGEKVRLDVRHDSGPTLIRADRRQLEQVLMNLVVNARDAMRAEGEIRIRSARADFELPRPMGEVNLPAGAYALLTVTDDGPGIAPESLDKIFEPFFTTKPAGEGTGLGLSTAYGIVKQSGGFIFVQNAPSGGAEFSVYLPIHDNETIDLPAPPLASPPASLPLAREGVILLVEDEAPVRAFAARALRLRGYTVLEAEDGQDALELLNDPALDVRLFISDVIMQGLEGPAWVRIARETRPDVPVIFISGYAAETFFDVLADLPKVNFLAKPFSLNDLTVVVGAALSDQEERLS